MKSSVIGFPRIGKNRELKFASEKYFSHEIDVQALLDCAKERRMYGWEKQSKAGIDYISSNDFSFYDGLLDTAVLFNIIPQKYKALGLTNLDEYFAMARGYQGDKGDVKALAMKKWFNTNYHYMVPEIDDNTEIRLPTDENNKALSEYTEAKQNGFETKPVLQGPYTLFHFARFIGSKTKIDYTNSLINAYAEEIVKLSNAGAKWIQLDEGALVFDMNKEDVEFFSSLYTELLQKIRKDCDIKILLQTYFGDVRDCFTEIEKLKFDGIGLDFVEGKKSLELVKTANKSTFENTLLFAGVVNSRNIWRSNYSEKIALIKEIAKSVPQQNIVINSSCSLLHVPFTVESETTLDKSVLNHFAFAEEKIKELSEIAAGFESGKISETNVKLFESDRVNANAEVRSKVANLKTDDFVRKPAFEERLQIQKKEFNLPEFPTTTIGSFPQTREVRKNRSDFKKGLISKEQYESFIKDKINNCIKLQEDIGLDVLVHGEFERNDMVEYFGENLEGFLFTKNAWVQSYGTRCVKPPVIWGDVSRKKAITVDWSKYAQSCSSKVVKGMLTGPVTILNWSFPREDMSIREQTLQIAFAIREEVLDLERNGIKIIQVDEAALREKLPLRKAQWHSEYLDWAIPAFRLVHTGVKAETQIHTHMCYSEFNDIIKDIDDMDADVITFEASRSDLTILDALKTANFKTQVGPGVYDIHSPRVPSVTEIVEAVTKMISKVGKEKLWVNPDCGLKTRGDVETTASLKNLVEAAKELRSR